MAMAARTNRRGVAMLLVLIALFTGTIIAAAYLASRDNSAAIGENVNAAAAARWSATSGLEMGVAIMETDTEWRTLHTNGKLIDDYPVGNGTVDVDIKDLETGLPPTDESAYFEMISTAVSEGVEQSARAFAHVEPVPPDSVDVDLSEFVIFTTDHIYLYDDATVARWPEAPLSDLGLRLAFGTQAKGMGDVKLSGDSVAIDATVFHGPGASESLVDSGTGPEVDSAALADDIPLPDPPDPGVEFPKDSDSYPYYDLSGAGYTLVSDFRAGSMIHKSESNITFRGDVTLTVNHDFHLESNSTLTIDGNVTIIAFDDFRIKQSAIQLTEDSTLTIFVRDDFNLEDAYIGDAPYDPDTSHDSTGGASYMDPQRVMVYSIEPDTESTSWYLKGNSVMKGSIYAPHTENLEILNSSALYGRVAVQGIEIKNSAALFYDHALDSGTGYTADDSDLYDEDGNIKDVFKALASLDDAALEALAADGYVIYSGDKVYGEEAEDEAPDVGDVTPRTVAVEYEIISFGSDTTIWEDAGSDAIANTPDVSAAAASAAAAELAAATGMGG